MDNIPSKTPIGGLARKLIQVGLLKEEQAAHAQEQSTKQKIPLVTYLVNQKIIGGTDIALICSKEFGLPLFDLNTLNTDLIPKDILKGDILSKHHALPIFKRGNRLFVAISDPTNLKALDEIKYQTNINTEAILVEEQKLNPLIEKTVSHLEAASLGAFEDEDLEAIDISAAEEDKGGGALTGTETDEAPIVRFINKLLLDAVNTGASDLHFEPYEKSYRIRFRQDGILSEISSPPVTLSPRISARLKVMSRLDISERRVPQDGRFKMRISSHRVIDFRVSTCPTLFGEKVVMRVLDPSSTKLDADTLGFEDFQKQLFLKNIHKPQGMVIVTGPTGSGKTVTLYTALNILNTPEVNISSCEDPVEINLPGINQVNVNVKAGLTFASALRAFLRQDPDIIMVGEIRDLETAEIAIKAAQTGHMVLSTLHTNSAADSLTRLINMGIPAYNLATSVSLVIAQRLARKLCPNCKVPVTIPEHALLELGFKEDELKSLTLFGPKGCELCKEGYKGRIAIYELMPVTPAIGNIVMEGGNAIALSEQALKEGMWDLRRSVLHKVKQGLVSLEEINRVTKD